MLRCVTAYNGGENASLSHKRGIDLTPGPQAKLSAAAPSAKYRRRHVATMSHAGRAQRPQRESRGSRLRGQPSEAGRGVEPFGKFGHGASRRSLRETLNWCKVPSFENGN